MKKAGIVCLGLLSSELSNPRHTRPVGEGVDQGALPLELESNVELDCRAGGRMAQTLPGMLDLYVIPRNEGVAKSARSMAVRKESVELQ